jgi:hypothetical protein
MRDSRPHVTATAHELPFDKLSPRDFERLCLWLVEREGYERAEHLGAAGSEQGRDVVAWCDDELWAFQCKRVRRFGPKAARTEVSKVLKLPEADRPKGLVFIVTCDVRVKTRDEARKACAGVMSCEIWAGTELDQKVKRHADILREFFVTESLDADAPKEPEKLTFAGGRENSGSIFEDLETDRRQRFGSQDTKHNDTCWVGRRRHSFSTAFVDVHLLLPGVALDRLRVQSATFLVEDFVAEGDEITRWLGPLMVLQLDYGELDVGDVDNVLDQGQTIRSYENVFDLYKPTDITAVVRELFQQRQEHLRLVFVFPGRAVDKESPGIVRFEPGRVKVTLEVIRT